MKQNKSLTYLINFSLVLVLSVVCAFSFSGAKIIYTTASAPYYSLPTDDKTICMTFNVYGGEEYLDSIVDTLKRYNAKATFFVGGVWASKHEDKLKMLAESGNEIGNHGYLHRDHKSMTLTQNKDEIKVAERTIESVTGIRTNLFAPPSGAYSDATIKACDELGYKVIMWSKDTIDWRDKDSSLVISRATKNAKAGDIILMHPTKHTLDALPEVITRLKGEGFELKTVGESIIIG